MNMLAPTPTASEVMESVLIKGDLSKLTPQERSKYYMEVCNSVGLNPLTKPFEYITLNGKLTLYALRTCTDQLRKIHNVSVEDLSESERDGVFIVTAKVKNGDGRTDMAKGAVTIGSLKGDALANALMKAETKAKRRATLSLCGLGVLDETELETIPSAAKRTSESPRAGNGHSSANPIQPAPVELPKHDPATGEVGPYPIPIDMIGAATATGGYISWGSLFVKAMSEAQSADELFAWEVANAKTLDNIRDNAPKIYDRIKWQMQANAKRVAPDMQEPTPEDERDE